MAQNNGKNAAKPKSLLIDGWEVVIGIEIHTQLATQSKIFSGSSTEFGQDPNTQASLVDLAMPGVLPVLNKEVVDLAIRFGLGIDAYIDQASVFARKNYFYPDSPKGYQISQMDNPIVGLGHIDIQLEDGTVKRIGVTRAHLEEDAGKSIHDQFEGMSGIDLNRAGTPLLEIVSEPDMRSVEEAVAYIKAIHTLVRWLGISDGNMAEGSFRADCNVSLRRPGQPFGTRCELKNLNSFRFIEQAINVEIERQMEILEWDGTIDQETRLFDPVKMETRSMRSKEEANDYRYFPDPDLLPVIISDAQIETARAALPELPAARRQRFVADFGVTEYDAHVLTLTREMSDFYEVVVAAAGGAAFSDDCLAGSIGMGHGAGAADAPAAPGAGRAARVAQRVRPHGPPRPRQPPDRGRVSGRDGGCRPGSGPALRGLPMTASATAKLRQRAERAEAMAVGMGFLLVKLRSRYGADFGVGIGQQVDEAIRDYLRLEQARAARQHAANLNTESAARSS